MLWSNRTRASVDGGTALLDPPDDLGADAMPAAPIPVVHPPAALYSLHFWVRYTLGEYVGFMWEHGGYLIRRRHIRRPRCTSRCCDAAAAPTNSRSTSTASCAPAIPA